MQLCEAQRVSEEKKMTTPPGARGSRGESFMRRRGMMGGLCFVFSDVTQILIVFPFSCENFHVLNVTRLVGQKV
jgi:hypothetical protein